MYPLLAVALKDFRSILTSWRVLVASIILASVMLLAAWGLSMSALGASQGDVGAASALWQKGSDGALATLIFAVVPFILPLLPVLMAFESLRQDHAAGLWDLYLSQPSPKPSIATGKFLGLLGSMAAILVPLSGASVLLIQAIVGTPVATGLIVAFVALNVVLGLLYLLLSLFLGALTNPSSMPILAFLGWVLFNALALTGPTLLGQMIGLIGLETALTFKPTWIHLVSFTGIYDTLVALYIPADLGLVVGPGSEQSLDLIYGTASWAALAWGAIILAIFGLSMARVPGR